MPQRLSVQNILTDLVAATGQGRKEWLTSASMEQRDLSDADLAEQVSRHWAMARRKLGTDALPATSSPPRTRFGNLDLSRWTSGDAGRVALLMDAMAQVPDDDAELVRCVFRNGDENERAALVRALALLDSPQRFRDIALEAGRVNSLVLFGALAEFNPYPALFYTDPEFNQLVLKTIFTGLSIAHIVALDERANDDLSRMCEDFHDERLAAGRSVPADMWLALAPHGSTRARELVVARLADPDTAHRFYASLALSRVDDPTQPEKRALMAALDNERDERVREQIQRSLAIPES